jgi:DHA2 family multidrug resistance protein
MVTASTRWLIIVAVMSATLMQVLDTTIVNVALPHMQGSLDATPDEISWTLTSYLVASAIFMPLTGYLSDRLGRKQYLLICIAGFTIASALCGASMNLTEIVSFRLLQGMFGAALVPLSQAIITDIYSEEERGKGMAIWGMGVMIGPILGPTLGGYLTQVANWRWTFYVNVPVGILAVLLAWRVLPNSEKKSRSMDWLGLLFISIAIGALQYLLDRGNQQDWFNASDIRNAALISCLSLIAFLLHSFWHPEKVVFNLRIFKDRNFTIASILLALMGLGMYGAMVIQPLMLENLLNYPVLTTGLVMAPRGISGMITMLFVGKIIHRVDPRYLITFGIICSMFGTFIGTLYSQNTNLFWFVWPLIFQGVGVSLIFVPLSTVAFSTLPETARVEGAGLFSLLRTLGSSIGISIATMVFTRQTQISWNQLGGFIQPYNTALQTYLNSLHLTVQQPLAGAILGNELNNQAQMLGFVDTYYFIMWGFLIMLPLVLLLKRITHRTITPSAISHE